MKHLMAAGLAVGMLTLGAPVAQAHPNFHYLGGCGYVGVTDSTPGGLLGSGNSIFGVAFAAVVATTSAGIPSPTTPITVSCDQSINGSPPVGVIRPTSGTGVAAAAVQLTLSAASGSVVQFCEHVTVGGETHNLCRTATERPLLPQPVTDLIAPLKALLDSVLCPVLGGLAPGVPPVTITPAGDVSVGVFTVLIYDCPPYNGGGLDRPLFTRVWTVIPLP
jgi:hypothetical protein